MVTSIFFNLASRLAFLLFSHANTEESFFCALLNSEDTKIPVIKYHQSSYHDRHELTNSYVIQQKVEFYYSLEFKERNVGN